MVLLPEIDWGSQPIRFPSNLKPGWMMSQTDKQRKDLSDPLHMLVQETIQATQSILSSDLLVMCTWVFMQRIFLDHRVGTGMELLGGYLLKVDFFSLFFLKEIRANFQTRIPLVYQEYFSKKSVRQIVKTKLIMNLNHATFSK